MPDALPAVPKPTLTELREQAQDVDDAIAAAEESATADGSFTASDAAVTVVDGSITEIDPEGGAGSGGESFEASPIIPVAADFTQVNFDGANTTLVDGVKAIILNQLTVHASHARAIVKAAAADQYIRAHPSTRAQGGSLAGGIVVRNSTNGRMFTIGFSEAGIVTSRWNSIQSWAANVATISTPRQYLPWWRVLINGGVITFRNSPNGIDWALEDVTTETIATWLTASGGGTADQVGVWLWSPTNAPVSMFVSAFQTAAPT